MRLPRPHQQLGEGVVHVRHPEIRLAVQVTHAAPLTVEAFDWRRQQPGQALARSRGRQSPALESPPEAATEELWEPISRP